MVNNNDQRPNPDILLQSIRSDASKKTGKLKIYFGYAAGVGKTYAMLDDAHEKLKSGVDVVAGYIEPHTRPETMQLLNGLSVLSPRTVEYKNIQLKEFDLDAALKRKPELILVDELAHSNANGVRNKKRYQDIEELLNAGIDVYTTVNVQHIESLNDIVQGITKINVHETIPDYIFDNADEVNLIDIEPDELLRRFQEGKIYRPERAEIAVKNFFTKENLRLLREVAMRKAADRISHNNQSEQRLSEKMASIKLMVCISSSPSSAKCIRWTARTAEAFHAPWIAVYVENIENEYITENEKKNMQNNLDLAERLGAEIVTLNGHDIASVIAEYAKHSGITNIVIGKSRNKKTLKSLFEVALEDRLISMLSAIEVHIIPGSPVQRAYKKPKRIQIGKNLFLSWKDTLKTISVLTAATLISLGLRSLHVDNQNIIMVYILSVLIVSRISMGYVYGILASVLSVLIFNFLFILPHFSFYAIESGYPITFVIMLLAALITSALTVRIKTQAHIAVERERRTEVLYEINKKLLAARGLENIVNLTNEYIVKLFDRSVIFYTQDPEISSKAAWMQSPSGPDVSFMLSDDERAVAHWVFINKKRAGAGTDTLMGAGAFYMPVISQGNVLGVIGLSCMKSKLNQNNRLFLRMIASQVAMALERQYLSDKQRQILIESEKENLRSNLLRVISHDLRTPLTGILDASSSILESGVYLDRQTQNKLSDIKEDSQWLIHMVENLLSVTHINEGTMNVIKTMESAEKITSEAINPIQKRFPNHKITVKVPEVPLMVPMDGILIEQVLINLLENAIKHSPEDSEVLVEVEENQHYAVFKVTDSGKGIPKEDFPYLFESNVPKGKQSSESSRGMGIGLSICMSIVKAHHGKMEAANKKEGGAVFQFTLPLEENNKEQP
ncbi:MAG: sensor histidine kinase KdpD [Bacillota bacterium]|nr:sensor histidine kinase KdpD [Bacillota bacterium]